MISLIAIAVFCLVPPTFGQITSLEGDDVLHAPYHGTITSLRECTNDIGYGEILNHVEPRLGGPLDITDAELQVWVVGNWDRSVLRMYRELDASGDEVNLTDTTEQMPALVPKGPHTFTRLSFKAIGVNTLAPQDFTVHFKYNTTSGLVDVDRTITVSATTGSFCMLPGLEEAFHLGTPILDVTAGNAQLTIPVGRSADMIGAAFIDNLPNIGNDDSAISRRDCLLPGAAESLHIMNSDHFQTSASVSGPNKTKYGTPWAGHLTGYRTDSRILGPDATRYDSLTGNVNGLRRIDFIRPLALPQQALASQEYDYGSDDFVDEIRDHAPTNPNRIVLTRTMDDVSLVSVRSGLGSMTDLRSWQIQSDVMTGVILGVVPNSGKGARYFSNNSAGRVTEVRDSNQSVMYQFTYSNDADGNPTVLDAELRFVNDMDGLRVVVEHDKSSGPTTHTRREFVNETEYRQTDFEFDTANSLNHRLAKIKVYEDLQTGLGGVLPVRETTFTHDVNNASGTMVITQVVLPDSSTLTHEYDAPFLLSDHNFGFRTKTTRTNGQDVLTLFDVDYEFFYPFQAVTRLFHRPRIVKQRDGRGPMSEVTFDYEDGDTEQTGDGLPGEQSNFLLSRAGPTVIMGTSGTRIPEKKFTYATSTRTLMREETRFGPGASDFFTTDFEVDALLRVTKQTIDNPVGDDFVTEFLYCDTQATQDQVTIDPDGFVTRTQFDDDGRVAKVERFLISQAVTDPCAGISGGFYATTNTYDVNGRLSTVDVEDKNQLGLPASAPLIATVFTYDRLGQMTKRELDPGGIGQTANFVYNWLGDVVTEFDTSGRGIARSYDGRGLVDSTMPLLKSVTPGVPGPDDRNLETTFQFDAMGNLQYTNLPTGAMLENVYDSFDRVFQEKRHPGPDGGNIITTEFEYDEANHITRRTVEELGVVLSDSTAKLDEEGLNYETRQRLETNVDGSNDPVTQFMFDWSGNVIEERSPGDATVADRVITTVYDGTSRIDMISDSEGGQTDFDYDKRGNVTRRTVKLDAMNSAVTDITYDALSRLRRTTFPEDANGLRHFRDRVYNSRGDLLRETWSESTNTARKTTVFAYDNASRRLRSVGLADPTAILTNPLMADVTVNRVTLNTYDADGREMTRTTYNNNSATPNTTTTTYDDHGRIDVVTDPSASFTDDDYAANGRLDTIVINDGVGSRTFTIGYDGHDRETSRTEAGSPPLVTSTTLDALDRRVTRTDPRDIVEKTDRDLAGRPTMLIEDLGGPLERQTEFTYNCLGQLITQVAKNKNDAGGALPDQATLFRYDSLGRMTRVVYPDNTIDVTEPQIAACTDCLRLQHDDAGRVMVRTDQRGFVSTMEYDDRGLLITGTTGSARDSFEYDALGRRTLAQRGTTTVPDADASCSTDYTGLGDLDFEAQTIAQETPRTVDYGFDQSGNFMSLTYPGTESLSFSVTPLGQVDTVHLGGNLLIDHNYDGRLLDMRRTITTAPGGNSYYGYDLQYDPHRRISEAANTYCPDGIQQLDVATYGFTHDEDGNPETQSATGVPGIANDNRVFTVDSLNRLTNTDFTATAESESVVLDLAGNRESHTDRDSTTTAYVLENAANEYSTIGGTSVTYDEAGNLSVDESGRQYTYDERNRLIEVKDAGLATLASYTYDALGRRIAATIDGQTTRYYYRGSSVIEERDQSDVRKRYHVNGGQYVDERVTSFDDATGDFTYYLSNDIFSVVGTGAADGTITSTFTYGAYGKPTVNPVIGTCTRGDVNEDGFVNGGDLAPFLSVLFGTDTDPAHICAADIDGNGVVDFTDSELLDCCILAGGCDNICSPGDIDQDGDVDKADQALFIGLLLPPGSEDPAELCAADVNQDGLVDGGDIGPFNQCLKGVVCPPPLGGTFESGPGSTDSTFFLHGRIVDFIDPDPGTGLPRLVLQFNRARYYDVSNGRWLQRDPADYVDGNNLYESFGTNPLRRTDPRGTHEVLDAGNDLVYQTRGFEHPFGRGIVVDRVLTNLVLIDHPYWPFAFVMRRQDAKDLLLAELGSDSFQSPLKIMQRVSAIAIDSETPKDAIVGILSKRRHHNYPGGWAIGKALDPEDELDLRTLASGDIEQRIADLKQTTIVVYEITTSALAAPTGLGGAIAETIAAGANVASGHTSVSGGAVVITAAVAGAFLHLRVADDAIGAAGGVVRRGGAAPVRAGVAAEERVAAAIGVPRNIGAGRMTIESLTGTVGFRVPDFGPEATIALRGSIVEVKNVTRLRITPQIRDLIAEVRRLRAGQQRNLVLEIFTNGRIPASGEILRLRDEGLLIITPIP
jgi:RHS repeat-associated protein